MKEIVLIKSFPNGIALHLDEEAPFEDILAELANKFSEAKAFFGDSSMALSIENRQVNKSEILQIMDTIHKNCNLKIVCLVGRDEETNKNFIKALAYVKKKVSGGEDGQFFKGNLKNNEVIETENSIIVLGDVYPGSAVISSKNIIILGGLYGKAYAGGNGMEGAFVAALEMEPEELLIGDFKYKPNTKTSKWGIRPKVQPRLAYIKNNKISFEPLTKDLLSSF